MFIQKKIGTVSSGKLRCINAFSRKEWFYKHAARTRNYIAYRLQKSKETLEDARLLANNQRWNAAVNRLYYARFYAVSALLTSRNIEAYTHSGCKTQFGLHLIKTGEIDAEQGRLYADLMDWRQKGDYGDMFDFDKETVEPLFAKVEAFLEVITAVIRQSSSSH